jgi:threonine/homoserine/homoserine lactone efflux protein
MSQQLFLAFLIFAAVALFTPGPNNVMLMASGVNFGFRRTQQHILGVVLGFGLMIFLVALGAGTIFTAYPPLYTVIKYLGAAYLLYLAWKIASAEPGHHAEGGRSQPMTFLQAAAFQWVNAKGWTIAIGASATYAALAPFPWNAATMAGLFIFVGFFSSATWALFGTALQPLLTNPRAARVFNVAMGLALVASLYPVFAWG